MKNIKKNKQELFFIIVLLAAVFAMLFYSAADESFRIVPDYDKQVTLNQREKQFVMETQEIRLQVSEELEYLNSGFLDEYVNSVINLSGLTVRMVRQGEKADAALVMVTDEKREQIDRIQFTAPLFQISGTLFLNQNYDRTKKELKGICIKGQFTEEEKKDIFYGGKQVQLFEADSVREAVQFIREKEPDCILGDRAAIMAALKDHQLENSYDDMFTGFFENNVCIMTSEEDTLLYSILNQCIHTADLKKLIGRAQERWFGITESFLREERYSDATALLLVVFAAVFCTFFIYYKSNKTLYDELTDRMNQLIASKKEMQTTFNSVTYYMAELDPAGVIIDINNAFRSYINDDALGRTIGDVLELTPELQSILEDMIKHTRETGRGTSQEVSLKRNILEINIFSIRNSKEEIEKLLFMASDITGERMAERQMLQDNKMIAVGQLAAGVAHEIRNPLGVIRNYCYVLKHMKDEESQIQAVQAIEKSVVTAGDIIENLLNFSRVSNKQISEVLIKEHINSVISLNNGMMKKKKITVSLYCPEDFYVKMAVESFDMILINLISNAVDAMEPLGELMLAIGREEGEFSLEVTDTGSGIEEDILSDIFNPFFTTKGTTGTGLGLYIVYNEIQKMNGEIIVNSKVGAGTTFKVILPVRAEEESNEQGNVYNSRS